MFEQRGARMIRCPLVGIRDAPDAAPVEAWIRRFIRREMLDLILMIGEGLRRLMGFAERAGLGAELGVALTAARKITRGPKPVRALRELGLGADVAAAEATTGGVIASLTGFDLRGRRIGLQLYSSDPNALLQDFLRAAGAEVDAVAPYAYSNAADDAQVIDLIEQIASDAVDAIAFTSAAQMRRLCQAAERSGLDAALTAGMKRLLAAAVGPVVAKELAALGVQDPLVPERAFAMKPLVNLIARGMAARRST